MSALALPIQRLETDWPAIQLGHYGLCVTDFSKQLDWYTRNFNLVPTDFLFVPDAGAAPRNGASNGAQKSLPPPGTRAVATFCHVDRGQTPVDHHSFFMTANATPHVHHCSFEIHDVDTQYLGHTWLAQKGYESVWGVGRHILGSQIFDYWWDTTGFMVRFCVKNDWMKSTPLTLF